MSDLSDDLMRELLKSFQIEAVEHLDTLNQSLLQLERSEKDKQRRDLIQDAFRAVHSLKGASRAVSMDDIETLSHAIESVLQQARGTNVIPESDVCDVLYDILDAIKALLDGQQVDIAALQMRLASVTDELAPPAAAINSTPVASELDGDGPSSGKQDENGFRIISDDTIRVAVGKLDTLMAQSSKLVISKINAEQRLSDLKDIRQQLAQSPRTWREIQIATDHLNGTGGRIRELLDDHYERLQSVSKLIDGLEQNLHNDTTRLGMMVDDLQTDIRRVRMLPVHTITLGLERAIRDAARVEGKQVRFVIEGSDVELDKKILETLKDPLLHLLRNAVSHGIETSDMREASRKPIEGSVTLNVRQRGSEVSFAVSDDGRGFDFEALREASGHNDVISHDDSLSLAFMLGISTSKQVTPFQDVAWGWMLYDSALRIFMDVSR